MDLSAYQIEIAKKCKSKAFKALPPICPEIDYAWTLIVVYYGNDNAKVLDAHFLKRFNSFEELQVFCDLNEIYLDEN